MEGESSEKAGVDPLASLPQEPAEADEHPTPATQPQQQQQEEEAVIDYDTTEQLLNILTEKHQVDLTADDMDPIEWTFRKLVPVPKYYYWDVVKQQADLELVPRKIRLWHEAIASMTGAYQWTERRVGMPLARTLGLTSSRFHDVEMWMDDEDKAESKRIVSERLAKERENSKNSDDETASEQVENESSELSEIRSPGDNAKAGDNVV